VSVHLKIYADGSWRQNAGGWGALVIPAGTGDPLLDGFGPLNTTGNTMAELLAQYNGLVLALKSYPSPDSIESFCDNFRVVGSVSHRRNPRPTIPDRAKEILLRMDRMVGDIPYRMRHYKDHDTAINGGPEMLMKVADRLSFAGRLISEGRIVKVRE